MINRAAPGAKPELAITSVEMKLLDRLIADKPAHFGEPKPLSLYLIKIARLGGYLARTKDPPRDNIAMWRGLSRLTDITLGAAIGAELVGS